MPLTSMVFRLKEKQLLSELALQLMFGKQRRHLSLLILLSLGYFQFRSQFSFYFTCLQTERWKTKLENLNRQNHQLQEQLLDFKSKYNKQHEELSSMQRKLREKEWELESQRRELNNKTGAMEKLRSEKVVIEKELAMMRDQMVSQVSQVQVLESSPDMEASFLQETISQLEVECKNATDERDMLQSELFTLQSKLTQLQADCDRYCRQSEMAGKTGNLTISRYEMQVQTVVKQRESFKQQLDDLREELKKAKETISRLQREVLQNQNDANKYKEESILKTHRIETLQNQNNNLEESVEALKTELSKCQTTVDVQNRQMLTLQETIARHEKTIRDYDVTVKSLQDEKETIERELVLVTGKLSNLEASQGKLQERVKEWESVEVQLRKRVGELETELEVRKEKIPDQVDGQLYS